MIQVTIDEARDGMVLAKTIYRDTGEVLLSAGYRLTDDLRFKLEELGFDGLWVQEEGLEDILPEEIVSESTMHQASEALRQNAIETRKQLQGLFPAGVDTAAILRNPGQLQGLLQTRQIRFATRNMLIELRRSNMLALFLNSSRTQANWAYQHAADTALVAAILGRRFAYSDAELEDLAFGCMTMDIGYLLLPEDLLMRQGRVTFAEFNLLKEHPTYGYEMLRVNPDVPLICAHVALQHHERQDGGGYPRRLIGRNQPPIKGNAIDKNAIHRYAEIAAVADEYVNLIKPRPGSGEGKAPMDVIKSLLRASGTKLNAAIVDALIPLVPLYSVGTRVIIFEDPDSARVGSTAVVSRSNRVRQDRPQITLLFGRDGKRVKPLRIDLEDTPGTLIREVLPGKTSV